MRQGAILTLAIFTTVLACKQSVAMPSFKFDGAYTLDQYWIAASRNQQQHIVAGSALFGGRISTEQGYLRVSLLGSHGTHYPTRDIGDLQSVSNIDTGGLEGIKIYELYWAHLFSRVEFSVGWRDLSQSFNVTKPALVFINSSFGTSAEFGSSGLYGPSIFPFPSFGVHFWSEPTEMFYIGGALSDPLSPEKFYPKQLQTNVQLDSRNHLALIESGFKDGELWSFGVGAWNLRYEREGIHPGLDQSGYYLTSHLRLQSNYSPFLRWGQTSDRAGRLTANLVSGVVYTSLFFEDDKLGVGYSHVEVGDRNTPEEVYELVYSASISQNLRFSSSFQEIVNPAGLYKDGQMLTLRMKWKPF